MKDKQKTGVSRREFVKAAVMGTVASSLVVSGFPTIVPASVLKGNGPSNRINIGAIGTGRISRVHDLPGVWRYADAQIIAVCDLDSNRVDDAKKLVNEYYSKKTGKSYDGVTGYGDYRELLQNKDVDGVLISDGGPLCQRGENGG